MARQGISDIGSYDYQGALPAVYRHMLAGEKQNADINLSWETLQEINIQTFLLLHSTDGQSWNMIQQVPPSNTAESRSYKYLHQEPSPGANFYRLVEYNMDGSSKVINTIALEMERDDDIVVYPTLTQDHVYIRLPIATQDNPHRIYLNHPCGQIVREYASGSRKLTMAGLPAGMYYLHLEINGKRKVFRLIKM